MVFEEISLRKDFIDRLKQIMVEIWPKNSKLCVVEQNTPPKPVSQSLRQTDRIAPYLVSEKMSLIRKLSTAIRVNRSSFDTKAGIEISDKHPTAVEWSNEIISQAGANAIKNHIKFKVIVERTEKGFFKSTQTFEKYMVADAEFGKPIVFKLIEKKNNIF